ncbi:MAG: hypothetical protein GY866_10155 [Proteobacteria bacterium]|nr:hypothetical protein [Pseudomonadota bacterium]
MLHPGGGGDERKNPPSRTMVTLIFEFYESVSTGRLFEKSLMRTAGAFITAWPVSTRAENRAGTRGLPRWLSFMSMAFGGIGCFARSGAEHVHSAELSGKGGACLAGHHRPNVANHGHTSRAAT